MDIPPEVCTEGHELPQDSGEPIVVAAIDSAAPWFLTGWAEGVEVHLMIDLVPVSALLMARVESVSPREESGALPDHLEDIVTGSHPSLGEAGRLSSRGLLHRYALFFSELCS